MKNRISVLFSVILGALLITSCSSVFQPNKRIADIEVKASLSGTLARSITSSSDDKYSFIDEELPSSDDASENEIFFTYYNIILNLKNEYGLSEDAAYDVLADKIMENSSDFGDLSGYKDFWMLIRTNFGQESEKVYPYAKILNSIKSGYKSSIKVAYGYYSSLAKLGVDLSNGAPDQQALESFFLQHPDAIAEYISLQQKYTASLETSLPDSDSDSNFDFSTVSLKLNSVPFDQEVTFTLLINYDSEADIEPVKFEFTRFVNPGLNVFDFTPSEATATGDDVIDDDNGGSEGGDEGNPDPIVEPDQDPVVDPWEDYLTYYVSNSAAVAANGLEDDPMSLTAAFDECREKISEGTNTKFAIILKDDITLSETLTVPESAYIVITGNYDTPTKTIQAGERFNSHMFSIEDHANLGLSSVNLDGTNLNCQLFYCYHSVNEGDTETDPLSLTGTLTMENCTVTNFAGTDKKAIITMATGGEMTISGCTFENNTVRDTGAIYINNGTLNLNIEGLLDSRLSSLSTIKTNSFTDPYEATVSVIPCEIYLKGNGYFNDTNKFLNSTLYAVHVAGWAELTLNDTYYSGSEKALKIYSTTDGSLSDEDPGINTINVEAEDKVIVTDGGDRDGNKEKPTYITYFFKSTN